MFRGFTRSRFQDLRVSNKVSKAQSIRKSRGQCLSLLTLFTLYHSWHCWSKKQKTEELTWWRGARHSPELWGENRQRSLATASQLRSCPGSRTLLRTWQNTDGQDDLWELLSPVYKAGALRPCGLRKLYSGEVGDGDCGVEELDLLPLLALLGLLGLPFHLLDHLFSRQTETNNTLACLPACLHGRKCLTWFAAFENHAIHFHRKSLHTWSDWLWMVLLLDTDCLTLLNESFYFQSVEFTFTGTKYETFSNWQIISYPYWSMDGW